MGNREQRSELYTAGVMLEERKRDDKVLMPMNLADCLPEGPVHVALESSRVQQMRKVRSTYMTLTGKASVQDSTNGP